FVGWAVIVGAYALGAERWGDGAGHFGHAVRRIALGAVSVLALIAVGVAWTNLGVERLFSTGGGWVIWAAALRGAAAIGHGGSTTADAATTLGGRLGNAPGHGPAAVFLLVAAAFAWDAAALGGGALAVVAAGSLGVLAWIGVRTAPGPSQAWRSALLARLS